MNHMQYYKMNIIFLTLYTRKGASSRIRVLQFIPSLEREGINCKVVPLFNLEKNQLIQKIIALPKRLLQILSVRKYDLVFVQKDILLFGMDKLLILLNKNIIYEFDDAIFINDLDDHSFKSKVLDYRIKRFKNMLRISKHIIVENSYLADYIKKNFPTKAISIINTPIDIERYRPKETKGNTIFIGWIGSPTTAPLLNLIAKPLNNICKKYKNVKIIIIGAPDFKLNFPSIGLAWNEKTEVTDVQQFDIGLIPLDDKPFNKNRFGGKIVQYMAIGIPWVRSSIGAYKNIDKEIDKYCLASSLEEWESKLSTLIENKELRKRLGKRARKIAEEKYDLKKQSMKMMEVLRNVT